MRKDKEYVREEFNKKVKANIRYAVIILILILALGFYIKDTYLEDISRERNKIIRLNDEITREYINYLRDVNMLISNMVSGIEVDEKYYDTFLKLSINKYDHLDYIRYNDEKYDISLIRYESFFHEESNRCIRGLLLEEHLTYEQEKYLSRVYTVNKKIIDLYDKTIDAIYGENYENNKYELFYEGRMYYDLLNVMTEAVGGDNFKITTKLDKNDEHVEEKIREEDKLKKTPLQYAEKIAEIIAGKKTELINYNGGDSKVQSYKFKYDEDNAIDVFIKANFLYYSNTYFTKGDMDEELIDEKAEKTINKFSVESLKLVYKKYDEDKYVYKYTYYMMENEYIDLRAFVDLDILTDGTINDIEVHNLNIVDGTYKKITPKTTMEQAKSKLNDEIKQNIKSYRLVVDYDRLVYEFEYDLQGLKLYARVDADTGEIYCSRDTSYLSYIRSN